MAEAVHHFSALASIHPHFVILAVPDEPSLLRAQQRLKAKGVRLRLFVEPDLADQPTALATEPVRGPTRRLFRPYPLFRFHCLQPIQGQSAVPRRDGERPAIEKEFDMTMSQSRFGHHPCSYETFL